jgi:hypothetical protein
MIKNNNFETISRLLTFILIFSWVMACILSPGGVIAAGSMSQFINPADEEIATFDEAEAAATADDHQETAATHEHEKTATFDDNAKAASGAESAANVSSFLHAEHYQPPVYFPERQKRFVTSQQWMRILPFVVLFMLAFATVGFLKKRVAKTDIQAGKRATSEKIGIGAIILLLFTITSGVAEAQISYSVKDAVVSFLGEGREIYQNYIKLNTDVKQTLQEKLWWEPQESRIKIYYSKTREGAIDSYVFVLSDTLLKCGGQHRYCIKVSSKGQVEGVKILNLTCPYSFPINNERFLSRLKLLNTANTDSKTIDGVTGATISSKLTVMMTRRALLLFELLKESGYV